MKFVKKEDWMISKKEFPTLTDDIIENNEYSSPRWAIAHGHLEMVKHIFENYEGDKIIKSNNYDGPIQAIVYGHLEMVKYIFEKYEGDIDKITESDEYFGPRWAIARGNLEMVEYIFEKYKGDKGKIIESGNYRCTRLAIKNRHLKMVNFILKNVRLTYELLTLLFENPVPENPPLEINSQLIINNEIFGIIDERVFEFYEKRKLLRDVNY